MKKFLKVLKIVCIVLAILSVVAGVVCYIAIPNETKEFFELVKYHANQPLPIIGVSTLVVMIFIYKIFVSTKYGKAKFIAIEKKLEDYQAKCERLEKDIELKKEEINELVIAHQGEIDLLESYIIKLCGFSINQKAKDLANEIESKYDETKSKISTDLGGLTNELLIACKETNEIDESVLKDLILKVLKEIEHGEEEINGSSTEE